jgi:large subunit ribosomal protein L29
MDAKELRAKSIGDLQNEKQSLLREQFNLRIQRATGQLNQNHRFKQIRREVARINTIMNEKSRGAQ